MLNRIVLIFSLALVLCGTAHAEDVGKFTLVPKNGVVPFEAACFDNKATANLLTWKQFLEEENKKKFQFKHSKEIEKYKLDIQNLSISLEETDIRYIAEITTRDQEIQDLRKIISKNKKVNIPVIIASSVAGGIALGLGAAYAIDQAIGD